MNIEKYKELVKVVDGWGISIYENLIEFVRILNDSYEVLRIYKPSSFYATENCLKDLLEKGIVIRKERTEIIKGGLFRADKSKTIVSYYLHPDLDVNLVFEVFKVKMEEYRQMEEKKLKEDRDMLIKEMFGE